VQGCKAKTSAANKQVAGIDSLNFAPGYFESRCFAQIARSLASPLLALLPIVRSLTKAHGLFISAQSSGSLLGAPLAF
jgi:hypothetical protein